MWFVCKLILFYCSVFKYKVSCVFGEKLGKCLVNHTFISVLKLYIVTLRSLHLYWVDISNKLHIHVHPWHRLSIIKMLFFLRYHVGFTYYRHCQRRAEENAELRCTIEGYKEQIAEISKQLGWAFLRTKCIIDIEVKNRFLSSSAKFIFSLKVS